MRIDRIRSTADWIEDRISNEAVITSIHCAREEFPDGLPSADDERRKSEKIDSPDPGRRSEL
jgi:hypothetical protein